MVDAAISHAADVPEESPATRQRMRGEILGIYALLVVLIAGVAGNQLSFWQNNNYGELITLREEVKSLKAEVNLKYQSLVKEVHQQQTDLTALITSRGHQLIALTKEMEATKRENTLEFARLQKELDTRADGLHGHIRGVKMELMQRINQLTVQIQRAPGHQ